MFNPDQFLQPLDIILSEHDRQLLFCDRFVELANERQPESVREKTEMLLAFLTKDLPLHALDEEQNLFPLMKLRCRPDDGFDAVLAQLEFEHSVDKVLAQHIVIDLKEIAGVRTPDQPMRLFGNLHTFEQCQRRHLAWENSVVLPLACKRLRSADLEQMGRSMAARRGLVYPG